MARYFWVGLLFFIASGNSYSQDLIVTTVGDSIACKIVDQTKDYVHFIYAQSRDKAVRELTNDRVKSIVPGFYLRKNTSKNPGTNKAKESDTKASNLTQNKPVRQEASIEISAGDLESPDLKKWQFGLNSGYAYRLFKPKISSTDYELAYLNDLKSGFGMNAEAFYFPWKKLGFGVKYDLYKSKGERDLRTKDNITIHFLGGAISHKKTFQNKKSSVISSFWLGYQPYKNKARYVGQVFTLKANTMGWGVSLGLSHVITEKLALNFGASCHMGTVYKFRKEAKGRTETINLSKDNFEDLSRAELTIGLKFLQ